MKARLILAAVVLLVAAVTKANFFNAVQTLRVWLTPLRL